MISPRISFVFALALLSTFAEANTREFLELKLYNRNLQASASEIQKVLRKVDLESHGYMKEVTTKLVKEPGSDKTIYQKLYFYYKVVDCSRIQEIEQELDTLMPGVFGSDMAAKLNMEVKTRHLDNMGQCKVGLEILFKEEASRSKKAGSFQRIKRGVSVSGRGQICISISGGSDSGDSGDSGDSNDSGGGGFLWGRSKKSIQKLSGGSDSSDSSGSSDSSSCCGGFLWGRSKKPIQKLSGSSDSSDSSSSGGGFLWGRSKKPIQKLSGSSDSGDSSGSSSSGGGFLWGRSKKPIQKLSGGRDSSDSSDSSGSSSSGGGFLWGRSKKSIQTLK